MKGILNKAIKFLRALAPQAFSSTAAMTGPEVDTLGADETLWVIDSTTLTGTTPTVACKVRECATSGGTFADVTGATLTITETTTDNKVHLLSLNNRGRMRYQKLVATPAGTGQTGVISAKVLLGENDARAVTQLSTVVAQTVRVA